MNKQIEELALKCGAWRRVYDDKRFMVDRKFDVEKFAELIVQECAEIGDNYQEILGNEPECYNCRKVAYGIVDEIKQHFGVEE